MQQLSGQDAMFVHAELQGMPQHFGGVRTHDQSTAPGGRGGKASARPNAARNAPRQESGQSPRRTG